jgi:hypothetical protein
MAAGGGSEIGAVEVLRLGQKAPEPQDGGLVVVAGFADDGIR